MSRSPLSIWSQKGLGICNRITCSTNMSADLCFINCSGYIASIGRIRVDNTLEATYEDVTEAS
jgi:hypothetical protein